MAFLSPSTSTAQKHQMAGRHLCQGALTAGACAFGAFMLLSLAAGAWLKA